MGALALFKPVRPTARHALADAIAARYDAETAVLDARTGVGRGMAQADQAQERLDQATQAVEAAKGALASAMAASMSSAATLKARDLALRQARADCSSAADHLAAAQSALGSLQGAAIAAQTCLDEARAAVSNAANAVIADEALAPAINRCRALRAELDAQTLKLSAAINRELASLKFLSDNREKVTTLQTIESVGHPSFQITGVEWPRAEEFREASRILDSERKVVDMSVQRPVREAWAKALADLHSDPDAPLPCFLTSFVRGAN